MNSFHERIRSHGYAVKSHVKKHHKKYLGGFFAGFAVVKMILLLLGFFGFYNMGTSADFIGTTYNYQNIIDYPNLNGGFIDNDFWQNWDSSNSGDVGNIMNIFYDDNENNYYRQNWDRDWMNCDLSNMEMVVVTGRDNGLCDSEGCYMMVSQMNNGDENIVYLLAGDGDALDFEQLSITNVPNCVSIVGANIDSIGNNSTPQVRIILSSDGLILSGNNVLEGLDMIGGPVSVPDDVKNITLHNINLRGSDTDGLQILGSNVSLDTANVYGNENGIVISGNASYNIVNNVQIWGNGKGFILSDNENYNAINNSQIYNNEYGIYSVSDLLSSDLSMVFNNLDVYNNQYGLYLLYVGGDRYLNDIDMYNNDVDIVNVQDLKCCGVLSLETGSDTDMCDGSFLECSNIYENFENFGGEYNYLDVSWDYITNPYNEGSGFMHPWVAIGDDMIGRFSMDDVLYYSYGNGLKLQHQPLAWSGTDIVAMGVFDAGYYIGSNVESLGGTLEFGDISDTGYVMVTGNTTDTGVSNYSIFGDITENIIGEAIGNTTGILLSGGYGPKTLVTQLVVDDQTVVHFETEVVYTENEHIDEYTITYHDTNSGGYEDVVFTGLYESQTTNVEVPSWTRDGYILTWDTEIPETYPAENMVINAVWIAFDIDIVGLDKLCATEQTLSATTSVTGTEMMYVSGLTGSSCDKDVFNGSEISYTPGQTLSFLRESDNDTYVCFKANSGGVEVFRSVQVVGIDREGPDVRIIGPEDGYRLTSHTVDFEWYGDYKGCADISGYLLELSGGDLDSVFSLELGPDASMYTTGLEDGSYEWRLVATDTNGNSSDGKWQGFTVEFSEPKSNGTWNGQDSCLSGWDNDKFLDDEFWSRYSGDNDTGHQQIICALYGSGEGDTTAYTSGWNNWQRGTSCNVSGMNVQFVTEIPENNSLMENTIYVLDTGEIMTDNVSSLAQCSAILSKSGTILYTRYQQGLGNIRFNNKRYVILDNVSIDGINYIGDKHDEANDRGIYLKGSTNNTINNVQIYNSKVGVDISGSGNNIINNLKIYNNNTGLLFDNGTKGNIVNNMQVFNNNMGVAFFLSSDKNTINNTQFYNNQYGFYIKDYVSGTVFNNIQCYNNQNGFYFRSVHGRVILNNAKVYNNNYGILVYNGNSDLYVDYYGYLVVFSNIHSDYTQQFHPGETFLDIFSFPTYTTEGILSFDLMTNPKFSGENYLLNWAKTGVDLWGKQIIDGRVVEYSYGSGILTQSQPVAWSGNTLKKWGKYDDTKYIGSDVVKVTGSLDIPDTITSTIVVTGYSDSELINKYSIFGNIRDNRIGVTNAESTGIHLVGTELNKRIITQLWADDTYFATHFQKNVELGVPSCMDGWDNDYFLTPDFWENELSNGNIACALYGSGQGDETAYTMGWSGYIAGQTCGSFGEMTEIWTETLPPTLQENTIYILMTTGTEVSDTVILPKCTAIVSSMTGGYDTVLYSSDKLSTMISLTGKYGILDNVSVDGYNKYTEEAHTKNDLGILLSGAESNTFNVVKVYNNSGDGIKVINSELNLLHNIQAYNNGGAGIGLMTGSIHNSLHNSQSYRNGIGVYMEDADKNIVTHSSIYNNNQGLFITGDSNNNRFSVLRIYFNQLSQTYKIYYHSNGVTPFTGTKQSSADLIVKEGLNNQYYGYNETYGNNWSDSCSQVASGSSLQDIGNSTLYIYRGFREDGIYESSCIGYDANQKTYTRLTYTGYVWCNYVCKNNSVQTGDYFGSYTCNEENKCYDYDGLSNKGLKFYHNNGTVTNLLQSGLAIYDYEISDLTTPINGEMQFTSVYNPSNQINRSNETSNRVPYITNPKYQTGYLYPWSTSIHNNYGITYPYKIEQYSYGMSERSQNRPAIWSGTKFVRGGKIKSDYYIGSNVPRITAGTKCYDVPCDKITKVEHPIMGTSDYIGLVDTFELIPTISQGIPGWGYTGLKFRSSGYGPDYNWTKTGEQTQLTGQINKYITVYFRTGTAATYYYIPQYYGKNYFATHGGYVYKYVSQPQIGFSPTTTSLASSGQKSTVNGLQMTKKADRRFCISSGFVEMTGIWREYYEYMTGFEDTDLVTEYLDDNFQNNSPRTGMIINFTGPKLTVTGDTWTWTLTGINADTWLKLSMPTNRAEDAVEMINVSEYLFYYYDTQAPKINWINFATNQTQTGDYHYVVHDPEDDVIFPIPECTLSGYIGLSASEKCYIQGYLFTGWVKGYNDDWSLSTTASISDSKIGRTGNIQHGMTGMVKDWLGYTSTIRFIIEITNVPVTLTSVTTGYSDNWSGNMISVFGANEGNCGTGDLSVTGLVCDGLTGTLEGNILKNISFTDGNNTAIGYCDMRVIDNEYSATDTGTFKTGTIMFSRHYVQITLKDFTGGLGTLDCTDQNIFTVTGIFSEAVTGVVLSGDNVSIESPSCIGESNSAGCTGYTWIVTLLGGTGKVWIETGSISSSVGSYSGSTTQEEITLGNYAGNVGQVTLVSPGSGEALTGGNRIVNLVWSGLEKQGCADISGYTVKICTGTIDSNTGCTILGWTGWTSNTGWSKSDLEDGIYYWKVQGQNTFGKTGERSEVWMFTVDNTYPTGTGQEGLGLTGGFGDACTSESVFTVTGTFSEAVTGVVLSGENVTGLRMVVGGPGSGTYVWTGELTGGGTGKVWIETGNITDMHGNPYTGARPELVVGNYDNVGPNNPTNLQPNGKIYQTSTSLTWSGVVDSGCAGLSGYQWNLYTGNCEGNNSSGGFISAGDDLNYPSFNNLVNNQTYCREVISIDNYGHTGSASGSFTVSADNIGCEITAADQNSCTSGNVTLTLTGQSSRSDIYFSWTWGDFQGNWSGNSLTTGYSFGDGTVTGYIYQSGSNKSGTCIYTGINVDGSAPTIEILSANISVPECTTGTITATGHDEECGQRSITYSWSGGNFSGNQTFRVRSGSAGTRTILLRVKDAAGNITGTEITVTWTNSGISAHNFTGSTNVGNSAQTVNWKIKSDASDGACGSGTVFFSGFVNSGTKGICTRSGDEITYQPYSWKTGTDSCTIQIKDDEGSGKDVTIYWKGIDTVAPECTLNVSEGQECTSGVVGLTISSTEQSVQYSFDGTNFGNSTTTGVTHTGTYTGYVKDSVGNIGFCTGVVTTGYLDKDNPTIETGSWVGYECETGSITVTGHDASCGINGLTYSWSGLNFTGRTYLVSTGRSKTGTRQISVSVIDGVGHKTTSKVKYTRQDTGIQFTASAIDNNTYNLGEISAETVIQTGMIDLFGAREGNCETGNIQASTGDCEGATWGMSGGKNTIIPNDGQTEGNGFCDVVFTDDEGSTTTGKIIFGANTWQWSCVPGWNNDNFLDENFWTGLNQNLSTSKTEIICALYGTGEEDKTAYTKGWSGWNYEYCSGRDMKVVFTGSLKKNLDENTIYVLNTGKVVLNSGVNMAKCSAIVSRSGTIITSNSEISGGFLNPKKYSILDNLSVKGTNFTGYGVNIYKSSNNTVNHVATYGFGRGLLIEGSGSENNIINNFLSYNNKREGIRILVKSSSRNSLNNIVSFNNYSYGIFISGSKNNILNNVLVYNNRSHGINITNDAIFNRMNNVISFNNGGSGLYYNTNGSNYYYGYLNIFGNLDDGKSDRMSGNVNPILWTEGIYFTGGKVSFDMMINPVDENDIYLLDWSKTGGNLRGIGNIGEVVGYSYGSGISTQIQPVARSGNEIVAVGNAKTGNYIGSNVKKVTGDLELPGESENKNITVTGISADELVSHYSIFGDVNPNMIGQAKSASTGVFLSGGEGLKRLITQLSGANYFATHFEKSIMLYSQITLEEFTGGLGSAECTNQNTFVVTGMFSKAATGVVLTGENVEIGTGFCIGEINSAGCTGYTWTVTLVGGTGKVWIDTGFISGISGGTYASSGISEVIILGNYDAGSVGQVSLVSPISGTVLTGGNRTGNLVWSGLQKQGCAEISGYTVRLCTGTANTNTGCTKPGWTGWTSGTGWSKSGLSDGIYYRKVQGQNEYGKTGQWSEVRMFKVDNTYPIGTGQTGGNWLGLTGGFGDVCTSGNIFTVTGRFSEPVTGVVLSGENVTGLRLLGGSQRTGTFVWTGKLTGGTGKVWIVTGNIRDMNGNPYTGARPELVLGNYDKVGPNAVIFTNWQGTIYTEDTTLSWNATTDSGCAGVSGYNFKFVNGENCDGTSITSGFKSGTSLSVTGLVQNNSYTLCVQPVDKFGNKGSWTSGKFVVDLNSIGCVIEQTECSNTGVTLMLKPGEGVSGGTISLSWTGYDNMITGSSLQKLVTQSGLLVTGYIEQVTGGITKRSSCIGVVTNIDKTQPIITEINIATGYECEIITGSITMTDDGCGSGTYLYQWTGGAKISNNQYATGNTASGSIIIYVTGYDGVNNATSTGVQFIWYDSPITGNNFTVNVGSGQKSVNWKNQSNVSDGACGSETINFSGFIKTGDHGECIVSGNNITYKPSEGYEGSDSCTIELVDDEGTTGSITITFTGIDTKKPECSISYNPECTSGSITLSINATGATLYSWTGFKNTNMTGNSGIQKSVSVNRIYTGYVKDAAGNTGWCTGMISNISTGVLGAPTNLQPGSGAHKNGNRLAFSWSGVTDNGCRSVSGYKIFILSGEDTVVVSGVVNSGTSNWSLNNLANGTYEWYVETHDTLGGTNPSPENKLYVDSSGVVCTIASSSDGCRSSGNITLTLHVNKELSTVLTGWTHTIGSLTGTMEISVNTGINFTVYDLAGNSGQCSHNVDNFDFDSPTITKINIATGYECEIITGSITMTDDGCGSGTYLYQWTGGAKISDNQYATGNTASGSIIIYVTGYDEVNNATSTGVQFIWYDSEVLANDFTGSTNVGNSAQTVNWREQSEATDGACGSGTVQYSGMVQNGPHGTCTVSGNNITYTPNTGQEYQGGDNCVIELTDDEGITTTTIKITFTGIDTTAPECGTWTYNPGLDSCTTGNVIATLTGSTDTGGIQTGGGSCEITGNNNTCNVTISDVAGNTTVCTSSGATNIDRTAPNVTVTNVTGYECTRITGSVSAIDPGPKCGSLKYSWSGGNYGNKTSYGLEQNGVSSKNVTVKVKDSAGNETTETVRYAWTDAVLRINTGYTNPGVITGTKLVSNITGKNIFNVTGYGSCERVTGNLVSCEHATGSLISNNKNLSITPYSDFEGTGTCTIEFTDGDTTQTGTIQFRIDTKGPIGTGSGLGLTGGLGTGQCTHTGTFTVTGTFSEAVTGVILTGENVSITMAPSQGQSEYVWTVVLSGGIGRVRITGDIKDIYGNSLSGSIDELILGDYDNVGPDKVKLVYPYHIVPTTDTTLTWSGVVDSGCAGDVTYSYVITGDDYEKTGSGLTGTTADLSGFVNGKEYCRNVTATDKYGNNSIVSDTFCFTVNTDGIQCNIVADRTICGSGPIVLTLAGVGAGDNLGEWLSRSTVGNTGDMTETGSLTKTITGFVTTTGYVQNKWGQTGHCEFTLENVEEILDLEGSEITGVNYRSGYECHTGTIQLNVGEDGCGLSGLKYQWNGVDGLTSKTIYGEKAQVITGIFSAINGAGVTTNTGYKFEWLDSPVTATGFTVDLMGGNTYNWKELAQASDGACGSATLTATASGGTKGTCIIEGGNIRYQSFFEATGSDSCILTISDDDGGPSVSVVVNFDHVSSYVELISPGDNREVEQGNVSFTWIPKDVPLTNTIAGYIYQVGNMSGFVDTTGVTLNLPVGTYNWSVTIKYTDGKMGGHSDLWSVKVVENDGGGGLVKDYCPNGDNTDSYYDGLCDIYDPHNVADECNVIYSPYTDEQKGAYLYAYLRGITTQCPISKANLDGYLRRDEFAKMISVYAINVVGREPNYGKAGCNQFNDIYDDVPELQNYMKLACELELMGMHADGVTPKAAFDPYSIVTRAEFGTVFSRLLFGDMYNIKNEPEAYKQEGYRYKKHLQALKDYGVMTKVDGDWPKYLERRGRAMIMLERADNYGLFQGKSPAINGIKALFS